MSQWPRDGISQQKYGGKCVAIYRRRVIDSDRDLDRLMDRLERKGLLEKASLFRVPPKGTWFA